MLGSLYSVVDTALIVLASRKGEAREKKGKDHEIAQWEDDVRKSLASKKASAAVTLTKQEQALLKEQLHREALVRQQVFSIKADLERGLRLVRSLVAAEVQEFRSYMSSVAALLLEGALGKGSVLVGQSAFETYLVRSL
jgi:hypothetical protein